MKYKENSDTISPFLFPIGKQEGESKDRVDNNITVIHVLWNLKYHCLMGRNLGNKITNFLFEKRYYTPMSSCFKR